MYIYSPILIYKFSKSPSFFHDTPFNSFLGFLRPSSSLVSHPDRNNPFLFFLQTILHGIWLHVMIHKTLPTAVYGLGFNG